MANRAASLAGEGTGGVLLQLDVAVARARDGGVDEAHIVDIAVQLDEVGGVGLHPLALQLLGRHQVLIALLDVSLDKTLLRRVEALLELVELLNIDLLQISCNNIIALHRHLTDLGLIYL